MRTRLSRVHALFRRLGYPEAVARTLTAFCSTATPLQVFTRLPPEQRHDFRTRQAFGTFHLPQGAPTSPALANLAAFSLDVRIAGLAASFGAAYTRYADDLAFSGNASIAGRASGLLAAVTEIVTDEGYLINSAKTRVMPDGSRQQLTGLVVNRHVNVARSDYDALKAVLNNCRLTGPETQNRLGLADFRAHLIGRVSWVASVAPARGDKLRAMLERIRW